MKKKLFNLLILICVWQFASAQTYKGQMSFRDIDILAGEDVGISHYADVHVSYKVWILVGEPVYEMVAAVQLDESVSIPKEVLESVRVGRIKMKARIQQPGKFSMIPPYVLFDAGVTKKPFVYSADGLTADLIDKKFFSVTSPASPNWDKFMHVSENEFLAAAEAKAIYKSGFEFVAPDQQGLSSEIMVEWNVSSILNWLKKKDPEVAAIKEQAEDDFWESSTAGTSNDSDKKSAANSSAADADFWESSSVTSGSSAGESYKSYRNDQFVGFKDENGTVVVPAIFDELGRFSEGLCRAKKNEMWGYINTNGDWVVKPKYHEVQDFKDGMAKCSLLDDQEFIHYKYYQSAVFKYFSDQVIDTKGNVLSSRKRLEAIGPRNKFMLGDTHSEKALEAKRKDLGTKYKDKLESARRRGYEM